MKSKVIKFILSGVLIIGANSHAQEGALTGIAKLSCENYLCTPSPVKPAECMPSISAYKAACFGFNPAACAAFVAACPGMSDHPLSKALLHPRYDISQCSAYDLLTNPNDYINDQHEKMGLNIFGRSTPVDYHRKTVFDGFDYFVGRGFHMTLPKKEADEEPETIIYSIIPPECQKIADAVGDGFYTADAVKRDCTVFFYAPWDVASVPASGSPAVEKRDDDGDYYSECDPKNDWVAIVPAEKEPPIEWVEANKGYTQTGRYQGEYPQDYKE